MAIVLIIRSFFLSFCVFLISNLFGLLGVYMVRFFASRTTIFNIIFNIENKIRAKTFSILFALIANNKTVISLFTGLIYTFKMAMQSIRYSLLNIEDSTSQTINLINENAIKLIAYEFYIRTIFQRIRNIGNFIIFMFTDNLSFQESCLCILFCGLLSYATESYIYKRVQSFL